MYLAEWHHQSNEQELGQTLGDDEGQGGLACCSPWGCRIRHDWMTDHQITGYICSVMLMI